MSGKASINLIFCCVKSKELSLFFFCLDFFYLHLSLPSTLSFTPSHPPTLPPFFSSSLPPLQSSSMCSSEIGEEKEDLFSAGCTWIHSDLLCWQHCHISVPNRVMPFVNKVCFSNVLMCLCVRMCGFVRGVCVCTAGVCAARVCAA